MASQRIQPGVCERDRGLRRQPMVFHTGGAHWRLTGDYGKQRTSDICDVAREGPGTFPIDLSGLRKTSTR